MDTGAPKKTPLGRTRARLVAVLKEQSHHAKGTEDWEYLQRRVDYLLEEYLRLLITE